MTKKLTLDIDDDIWLKFKRKVPRDKKLNDAVVELIEKDVNEE